MERAFEFAKRAHGQQTRASGESYLVHPVAAAHTLVALNMDAATIASALLHDVVDDTTVTIKEIEKEFGKEIAFLVSGVTKLGKLKYRGVERQVENLRKMFLAMAEDIRVVLIKLADRLHNMESLEYLPEQKRHRIALETLDIYAPIADRLGIGEIKGRLEDLAFKYIYPKEYAWLMGEIEEQFRVRQNYIERLKPVFEKRLRDEGVQPLDIHARAKHYYSLYQKLKRSDMDVSKVYDLIALRAIVPDVSACYAALGAIHKYWKPLPGRIKDYIALPKPNGYQSLHTTVFCDDGVISEFQIRTPLMHDHAERGIAAHWAYAENGKNRRAFSFADQRLTWVNQLRDWQKGVRASSEFLESLKIDFFKNRIFVLTPRGDVIDLPEGATALDFAYHVHSEVGDRASGAKVNGRFCALDTELKNGDVVEAVVQANRKPSAKLIEIVTTNLARSQIRKALRRQGIETPILAKLLPKPKPIETHLEITVRDRVGLLKDISAIISRKNVDIRSISGEAHEDAAESLIRVKIVVDNKKALAQLLEDLKKFPDVKSVRSI